MRSDLAMGIDRAAARKVRCGIGVAPVVALCDTSGIHITLGRVNTSGIYLTLRRGLTITSEQVRAARSLLRWEQNDLAEASKLSLPAIKRMETVRGPLAAQSRSIEAIVSAF